MNAVLSSPYFILPSFPVLPPLDRLRLKIYPNGNKCGHDRANIRLVSRLNPHDIKDWDESHTDDLGSHRKSHFHYHVDERIDKAFHSPLLMKDLSFHKNERRKRSEVRESSLVVFQVIVHFMNFANRRFGRMPRSRDEFEQSGGFIYYDLKFLQAYTNFTESRIKRAIKELVDKDYIKRTRRYVRRSDGSYKAIASTTSVTEKGFLELGLLDKAKKMYKYAYAKAKKHAYKIGVNISDLLNSKIFDASFLLKSKKPANDDRKDTLNYWAAKLPDSLRGTFIDNHLEVVTSDITLSNEKALEMAYHKTKNI